MGQQNIENKTQLNDREPRKKISMGRYVGGGLAGTLLGFGVGHAIQGRYSNSIAGWFTFSQTVSPLLAALALSNISFFAAGCFMEEHCPEEDRRASSNSLWGSVMVGSLLLWPASRIIEIISVWRVDQKKYEIVTQDSKNSTYSILPLLSSNGSLGLSLAIAIPSR